MRLNFFINWSYDSFVIVLPNTLFQSVEERIFLKFSTYTLFMVRVDIFVFGHWLCILEFKIVNIGKWSLMSSLIIPFCKSWSIIVFVSIWSIAVALAHVTRVGLLITGKIPFSNVKLKKFLTGVLEAYSTKWPIHSRN